MLWQPSCETVSFVSLLDANLKIETMLCFLATAHSLSVDSIICID